MHRNKKSGKIVLEGKLKHYAYDCQSRVYSAQGIAPTLHTRCDYIKTIVKDSAPMLPGSIRKLTPPLECWRLMGFTQADYEKAREAIDTKRFNGRKSSDSRMCILAGNSIAVSVLVAIFEQLANTYPDETKNMKLISLFSGIGAFEKALSLVARNAA